MQLFNRPTETIDYSIQYVLIINLFTLLEPMPNVKKKLWLTTNKSQLTPMINDRSVGRSAFKEVHSGTNRREKFEKFETTTPRRYVL